MLNVFELMEKYQIKAKRESGQNFLLDQEVLDEMIEIADLKVGDKVLEVGPGLGVLTERLLATGADVLAVELDPSLTFVLKKIFKGQTNLTLLQADVLKLTPQDLQKFFGDAPYKIVANIPYNITAHFIRKFLTSAPKPTEMILMVQLEVAKRLTAMPGELSLLGVSAQVFSEATLEVVVPKKCFFPAPKVDSAVIRLANIKTQLDCDEKKFFQLVKIGFSAKRKTLANNLANGFHLSRTEVVEKLKQVGLKEAVRAQELGVGEWKKLLGSF